MATEDGSPELVLIEWFDSRGLTDEWEFKEGLPALEPSRCRSVGFLIDETDAYKTLAMTTSPDQVLGRLTIPAGAVVSARGLR